VLAPTTLLAQVDASVGGKTGLNHGPAKNVIGAFHQPRLVVSDTRLLRTLPDDEFRSGLAEVVKHGVIGDASLFSSLEARAGDLLSRDPSTLADVIADSVAVKARIVAADETDRGVRAALNFGHTFGHAIESVHSFGGRRHGEAVSIGMAVACRLSVRLGLLAPRDAARVESLLDRLGLPVRAPDVNVEEVLARLPFDKKGEGGEPRFVLTAGIGDARFGARIPRQLLEEVAREFFQ
jgi:3-dehydroquinate synthetase